MLIDAVHFTPWQSLAGGVALGVASAMFVVLRGRVLGISGILGGLLASKKGDRSWRASFLLGLLAAPAAWQLAGFDGSLPVMAAAGLLVGVGTRYGAGCTSGHGICGLSRLSLRSAVATACFMAAGFGTVFVVRHVLGGGAP